MIYEIKNKLLLKKFPVKPGNTGKARPGKARQGKAKQGKGKGKGKGKGRVAIARRVIYAIQYSVL